MRVIVFSRKSRPCQLDVPWRSLFEQSTAPLKLSVSARHVAESHPLPGPRVGCYQQRVLNLAMNRVDEHSGYSHAGGGAEELNARFPTGERLLYDHFRPSNHPSCHVAVERRWVGK